jgi:tryptophan synthase alpha chain
VNAIDTTFARLRSAKQGGLVTYVTAGDPDLPRSAAILRALPAAGADVIEVGVPFSDPLADGPVIQRASERALRGGATLPRVLQMLAATRAAIAAPVVLFTYANPIVRMGFDRFAAAASDAGVDGALILDLPIDECDALTACLGPRGIATIFLVSPTTPPERIRRAAERGSGFLYAISRLGVTGARESLSVDATDVMRRIRAQTDMPVALGFGIARPEHVRDACRLADAAVVGSAIVSVVAEQAGAPDLVERVSAHVRWLKGDA